MRMRLGILHDSAQQERMAERERKREEEKKRQAEAPTVLTELEQKKADEEAAKEKEEGGKKKEEKAKASQVKIRPLSEAKAIELGANFFSEAFVFLVAFGLIIFENYRSRNKAKDQREELADRLDDLEAEVVRLRKKYEPGLEALTEKTEKAKEYSWYNPAGWWARTEPVKESAELENDGAAARTAEPTSKESASLIVKQSQQAEALKKLKKQRAEKDQSAPVSNSQAPSTTEPPDPIDTFSAGSKNR